MAFGLLSLALLCSGVLPVTGIASISTLDELYDAIDQGTNKKVAFLSRAYFMSVHSVLPATTEPIYCDNSITSGVGKGCNSVETMVDLIKSGDVIAALDAHPTASMYQHLHIFSSSVVSTRAMLMAPAKSDEMPHGTNATASSYHLSMAVDAAIVALQGAGKDEQLRLKWAPWDIMAVHTCKGSDLSGFRVANYAEATGLLRTALVSRSLKVGAMGRYDWGGHSGNYLLDPPTGFYPDWLSEFCAQFNSLKGPDGVAYSSQGAIQCERVYQPGSVQVFRDLFDGVSHITEPYYIVDGFYTGTGEACSSLADCRPAMTAAGREECSEQKCMHPKSPRARHFRISCSSFGIDSKFMTLKVAEQSSGKQASGEEEAMPTWTLALLILLAALVLVIGIFACWMFKREKSGQPVFAPMLTAPTPGDGANQFGASA